MAVPSKVASLATRSILPRTTIRIPPSPYLYASDLTLPVLLQTAPGSKKDRTGPMPITPLAYCAASEVGSGVAGSDERDRSAKRSKRS